MPDPPHLNSSPSPSPLPLPLPLPKTSTIPHPTVAGFLSPRHWSPGCQLGDASGGLTTAPRAGVPSLTMLGAATATRARPLGPNIVKGGSRGERFGERARIVCAGLIERQASSGTDADEWSSDKRQATVGRAGTALYECDSLSSSQARTARRRCGITMEPPTTRPIASTSWSSASSTPCSWHLPRW